MNRINTLKPGVDKFWLFVVAGLIWSGVGIYLDFLAYGWLRPVNISLGILFAVSGFLLAVAIYAIMFKRFADLNIVRIRDLPGDNICIFAFQRWTSYPLVVVMISLGIFLRVYSPIPKPYLAVLYLGIGTSLFLASLRYYRYMFSIRRQAAPPPQERITDK
ncbi:MAG: hypothetical protein ABUK20_14805 [Anaerolineales bacterium]